jgi:ABC-2 type transport system ATP-binding protein
MITINNLKVAYQPGVNIINNLNLSLEENRIHGIVGLNGAGKTTLLNTLFRLIKPNNGLIMYKDSILTKKVISFLTTDNYFYPSISGREYLSLFENKNFDTERWNALFKLPLDEIAEKYSTGMKKKLALMSVLKQDKPLMILDEPFNGLDMETCHIVHSVLMHLKLKGKTIIITSHILESLTKLCDYIHYLENGKIKYSRDKEGFSNLEKDIFSFLDNKNEKIINQLLE